MTGSLAKPMIPPKGWATINGFPGIYSKVCVTKENLPECNAAKEMLGSDGGLILRLWCKYSECGDVYIEANQTTDTGAVLGWTNSTGRGMEGDVLYLGLSAISTGQDNSFIFAFPVVTRMTIGGKPVSGYPIGLGR